MSSRIVYRFKHIKKTFPELTYRTCNILKPYRRINLHPCFNFTYKSKLLFLQKRKCHIQSSNQLNDDLQYLSFYKYVNIENPDKFRDRLLNTWKKMGIVGRIYVAKEGINAQMSVPVNKYQEYLDDMKALSEEFNLGHI